MVHKSPHPVVNLIVFGSLLFGTGFGVGNAFFTAREHRKAHEDEIRGRIRNSLRGKPV